MREQGRRGWLARPVAAIWRLAPVLALLVSMWLATAVNPLVLQGGWLPFGIRAHDPNGFWPNLLIAPLLHAGLPHLLANSVPFVVLGGLVPLQLPWMPFQQCNETRRPPEQHYPLMPPTTQTS